MKKNIINLRNIFFLSAVISVSFVVFFVIITKGNHDIFDIIIGVSSIVVTAFLGIATYYQAKEQSQIDLLDKVPYLRIQYETFDFSQVIYPFNNQEAVDNIRATAEKGIKPEGLAGVADVTNLFGDDLNYIKTGMCVNHIYPLNLRFENASDCVMKRITPYICKGDYHSKENCFEKADNAKCYRQRLHKSSSSLTKRIIEEENKNIAVEKGQTIEIVFALKELINLEDDRTTTCSVALEIETLHGYVYTQYCRFSTTLAASNYFDVCYFACYGYDVDIKPGPINKKLLAQNDAHSFSFKKK